MSAPPSSVILPPLFADIIVIEDTVSVVSTGISFLLHELKASKNIIPGNIDLAELCKNRMVIIKNDAPKFT